MNLFSSAYEFLMKSDNTIYLCKQNKLPKFQTLVDFNEQYNALANHNINVLKQQINNIVKNFVMIVSKFYEIKLKMND